jgi:hypothetical protein
MKLTKPKDVTPQNNNHIELLSLIENKFQQKDYTTSENLNSGGLLVEMELDYSDFSKEALLHTIEAYEKSGWENVKFTKKTIEFYECYGERG